MRHIYAWVLTWAYSRYAPLALFILAFAESVFFPVPPDILLIALVLGYSRKAFIYASYCTLGSVSGAMAGYLIGHFAWINQSGDFTGFANVFFDNIPGFSIDLFNSIKELYSRWDFWIIFTAGFAPVPYKLFTVTAGVFEINLLLFVVASLVSRGARFFILTVLLWEYGNSIKHFIEKYFNMLALAFTVCLLGAIVIVKFVFYK
jgi:membrane protein YqaA with SNARE-associated domain